MCLGACCSAEEPGCRAGRALQAIMLHGAGQLELFEYFIHKTALGCRAQINCSFCIRLRRQKLMNAWPQRCCGAGMSLCIAMTDVMGTDRA